MASFNQLQPWRTFPQIVQRLHREGIYIRPEQLAEFFLAHGLPVDLQYVPSDLRARAAQINQHYRGEMARFNECLEQDAEQSMAMVIVP